MKYLPVILIALVMISCGGSSTDSEEKAAPGKKTLPTTLAEAESDFRSYDGIGPVKPFELPVEINEELAARGKEVYESMCTACHKADKKFIGPAPKGIMERRTPAWVMNMILNPEQMLAEDPIAKLLYVEYNMSPMANQNLTEEQARSVLEYFRTL